MSDITRWSPDTCDCVIDIEGDWENPVSVRSIRKCPAHAGVPDGISHLNKVWKEENKVKNQTFGEIEKIVKDVKVEHYKWAFGADRSLEIEIVGIAVSAKDKQDIKAACDIKWPNKVKVK